MEQTVNTVRNFLKKKQTSDNPEKPAVAPQIGFRVSFCETAKQFMVKVIGARQLPTDYGSVKPRGYLVKVTFYPQKNKFETKTVKDSWPTFNEEFTCNLPITTKRFDDFFKGKFISFTVYAILGKEEDEKPPVKKPGVLKRYFSFNDTEDIVFLRNGSFKKSGSQRRSSTNSVMNNRRIVEDSLKGRAWVISISECIKAVRGCGLDGDDLRMTFFRDLFSSDRARNGTLKGAVTYNLDRKLFTQKLRNDTISTPDIWRNVAEITSGVQTQPRDGTKGCVELTLQYGVSEDGTNDVVEVTVTKFRCSLQTMQSHEKVGGQLYIKITAFEYEDLIQKMKSDKFDPTISLKLEPSTSTLRATVNQYNIDQVKILIRLISRNIVGKKVELGKIEIDRHDSFWKEIVASPAVAVTKMINFV